MKKIIGTLIPKMVGCYFNIISFFQPEKIAKKAFILFCTPRKGKVLKVQKGFLEDAKDLLLEKEGKTIQTYRWIGAGPTVLLMHGWESNSYRWRNFIPILQAEDYNIIAMDAPAHGNSGGNTMHLPLYAECAQTVIETYHPKYIIGHSLGGMTMLYNQYKYLNVKVEKLVSLAAPSELSDFMRQYKAILGLSNKMMRILEAYFIKKFNVNFAEFSSSKFVKQINKKGLLIHDELDKIAPIWCTEQVHTNWQGSQLIRTKGLGHSLHQDKIRNKVVEFLKS